MYPFDYRYNNMKLVSSAQAINESYTINLPVPTTYTDYNNIHIW